MCKNKFLMTLLTSSSGNIDVIVYVGLNETDRNNPCNYYVGPTTDVTFMCPKNLVGRYIIVEMYPLNNKKKILRICEVSVSGYYLGN